MKTLRTVSALIVTVAMIAVMAIGTFAAENYDWNLLEIEYNSDADLKKARIEGGAAYSIKDGVLRMSKGENDQNHIFEMAETKAKGKIVVSTRFRTNSINVGLRLGLDGTSKNTMFIVGTNAAGNLFIKGSNYTVLEKANDEKWHEILLVVDLDAETVVLTVDNGKPFNGNFKEHSQSGSVSGIKRAFWQVNKAAVDNGYLDVDYFRISDGKIAQGGSDSGSGSTDKPGNPETSDATFVAVTILAAGAVVTAFAAKKHRK